MTNRLQRIRRTDEEGFTLVELLVVIVILGILAAVVVFAVGGINDKGQDSACKTDTQTIRTAEEATFAQASSTGKYVTEAALVPNFLSTESKLHNVELGPEAKSYTIKIQDAKCGTIGNSVGQTALDL